MSYNKKISCALISIVTPTYNRGQFLEKNILSIKSQDYPFIEHIVIDGLSTDNSVDILKRYSNKYNLKWISEKDKGYANALNKGFEMSKGDIVCWLDSDDFYLPGTIKKIVQIFENNDAVEVVFGDILISRSDGVIFDYVKHTDFSLDTLIYLTMCLNPQATFWKRELHQKIGKLDESLLRVSDADFFIRMGLSGSKFYHMREFLSVYRIHNEQLTNSTDLVRKEAQIILERYQDKKLKGKFMKIKRGKVLISRVIQFLKQGDIYYVVRGVFRRIKGRYLFLKSY